MWLPPAPAKTSKSRAREANRLAALGTRLAGQGQFATAIAHLRRSVELDSTVPEVLHSRVNR